MPSWTSTTSATATTSSPRSTRRCTTPRSSSSSSARSGPRCCKRACAATTGCATRSRRRSGCARQTSRAAWPPLRVLPVLIGGAAPPAQDALPTDLAALARLGMLKFDERSAQGEHQHAARNDPGGGFRRPGTAAAGRAAAARGGTPPARRTSASGATVRASQVSAPRSRYFFAATLQLFDFFGLDTRVAGATMLLASIGAPEPAWSGAVVLVGIDEASERAIGRKFDPKLASRARCTDRSRGVGGGAQSRLRHECSRIPASRPAMRRCSVRSRRRATRCRSSSGCRAAAATEAERCSRHSHRSRVRGIACAGLEARPCALNAARRSARRCGGRRAPHSNRR